MYLLRKTREKFQFWEKSAKGYYFSLVIQFKNVSASGTVNLNVSQMRLNKSNPFSQNPTSSLLGQFDYYCV